MKDSFMFFGNPFRFSLIYMVIDLVALELQNFMISSRSIKHFKAKWGNSTLNLDNLMAYDIKYITKFWSKIWIYVPLRIT